MEEWVKFQFPRWVIFTLPLTSAFFPQGLGGLRDYLDKLPERPSGNVLGIDIGFNTIRIALPAFPNTM